LSADNLHGFREERTNFNTANSSVSLTQGTAAVTGMPLANAMTPGNVYTGLSETSTDIYNQMRWRDYEVYAGDSWKVNRKVTVDLGVRYSLLLTPYRLAIGARIKLSAAGITQTDQVRSAPRPKSTASKSAGHRVQQTSSRT
jgi:hypothetical protein